MLITTYFHSAIHIIQLRPPSVQCSSRLRHLFVQTAAPCASGPVYLPNFLTFSTSSLGWTAIARETMGVLQPRGRRDSRASALSRNLMFDRDIHGNAPSESLVEHANLGSPPGPMGAESSSYNGSTTRTPNRSFYHRSFNSNMGGSLCILYS